MRESFFSTEHLARISGRRPWLTVVIWLMVLALSLTLTARYLDSALTMEDRPTNNPESEQAKTLLRERFPDNDRDMETLIVDADVKVTDPAYQAFVQELTSELAGLDGEIIDGLVTYYQVGDPSMVSKDERTMIIPVMMSGTAVEGKENAPQVLEAALEKAKSDKHFSVHMIGAGTADADFQEVSERDLQTGEAYGLLVAVVILAVVFGTLAAAAIPIILAITAIIAAIGATALLGQTFEFSFFVVNMITMMGLAVGIDYSLFIVSRFREERGRGLEKLEAIAAAGGTAGRAVFFSGVTVILALVGMLMIPHSIFKSLGSGAILVVIFSIMASMTLLPAVLSILGDRVDSWRLPFTGRRDEEHGFWRRAARAVMAHPIVSLVLTLGFLLAAAYPYLSIELGSSMGPDSLPEGIQSRTAYELLDEKFTVGLSEPVQVVIDGDIDSAAVQKGVDRLQTALASDGDFGAGRLEKNREGNLALFEAPLTVPASSNKAYEAVDRLRDDHLDRAFEGVEAEVLVGGATAELMDFTKIPDDYTLPVFVVVLSLSFILLTIVFRSLVVPLKAILMNLLSVGAAYGLIVLVFQDGVGAGIFGFRQVDKIEAWIPLFLFSVLFGLSMDYHVFLLSRIRERFDQTNDNAESVEFGLSSTGRIITGAALIMVAVFAGFAAGNLIMFQQMGFGLAVAVLLDATIVRSILVPASMKLLGRRNWYLPKFLEWLPSMNVEGPAETDEQRAERV